MCVLSGVVRRRSRRNSVVTLMYRLCILETLSRLLLRVWQFEIVLKRDNYFDSYFRYDEEESFVVCLMYFMC